MGPVKARGRCPKGGESGVHNWFVYMHDMRWWRVAVYCNRCGARTRTTADVLAAVKRQQEAYWNWVASGRPAGGPAIE